MPEHERGLADRHVRIGSAGLRGAAEQVSARLTACARRTRRVAADAERHVPGVAGKSAEKLFLGSIPGSSLGLCR